MMVEKFNPMKYEEALNNLLGTDCAYFKGDKDVETIIELIMLANNLAEEVKKQKEDIEWLRKSREGWKRIATDFDGFSREKEKEDKHE